MSENIPQHIDIPDNMAEYLETHYAAIVVSINTTDGLNGYGSVCWYAVELKRFTRTCWRCGYDQLWKPRVEDGFECRRHSYNTPRYDTVFAWSGDGRHGMTLEEAFDDWLKTQPKRGEGDEPVRLKFYGSFSPYLEVATRNGP